MKALSQSPNLVEQVRDALLGEITSGQLKPGERIIQEQIAQALGVSRQPVQQALMLLRNQGVLREAGGRGLVVTPLDPDHVHHVYQIRAAIEAGNAKDAAAAAHQLKSSSGGLGARRVQDLCARIEKRALDGEAAGQGDLVTDLERELAEALAHIAELAGKAA